MSDNRPIAIAMTVGTLAIAANGAAAVVALSATAQPEALGFGIAGLSAAFIGLTLTLIWARRSSMEPRHAGPVDPLTDKDIAAYALDDQGPVAPPLDDEAVVAAVRLALAQQPFLQTRPAAKLRLVPAGATEPAPDKAGVVVNLRDWARDHRSSIPA